MSEGITIKLMPCPFCGDIPDVRTEYSNKLKRKYYKILCLNMNCDVVVKAFDSELDDAVSYWNNRYTGL